MTAMNITDASRKRALLLHYVGEEVNDLFETLPDTGEDKDFKKAHEALTQYFTPTKNASFEIFKFRNLKQEAHETVDDFHTRLQIASKYCEFGENKDKEIKAQIELGTTSKKLRRYSFRSPGLSLTELLNHARTIYETEKQAKGIETTSRDPPVNPDCNHESEDIHKVQSQRPSQRATTSRHQFPRPPANTKPCLEKIYHHNHQSTVFVVAVHGPTLVENALPKDNDVISVSSTIILQEFVNQETEDKLKILPMLSKAILKIPNTQARMRIVQTATSIASTYMQPT